MSEPVHYDIPRSKYRTISVVLAVFIHLALLGFFWLSVSWQIAPPLTVEAEVWDMDYKEAAPSSDDEVHDTPHVAQQADPEPKIGQTMPEPAEEEEAEEEVVTPPKAATPPPVPVVPEKPAPKVEDPEIALEKKRKEEADKKAAEAKEKAVAEAKKQAELKKQQEEKAAKEKAEAEKQAQLKKEQEEKAAKEKAETEKQAKLKKEQDEKLAKQKAAEEKKKADAEKQKQAADAQAAKQRRQQEMQRMMNQAGGGVTSKTSNGKGEASKSQGPKGASDYASKIALKIKSNTIFDVAPSLTNNPAVEYAVELFPDGTVRSIHKNKSSGVSGFDEAVAQAIKRSEPFPPDTDGKVPGSFNIVHRPKDQ